MILDRHIIITPGPFTVDSNSGAQNDRAAHQVLTKAGFVPAGPADPADLGGKAGTWYQRNLAPG
jgi:hypothetical protein